MGVISSKKFYKSQNCVIYAKNLNFLPTTNPSVTVIKLTLNDYCKQSIIKSGEKVQRIIAEEVNGHSQDSSHYWGRNMVI